MHVEEDQESAQSNTTSVSQGAITRKKAIDPDTVDAGRGKKGERPQRNGRGEPNGVRGGRV